MNKIFKSILQIGIMTLTAATAVLSVSAQVSFGGEPLSFSTKGETIDAFDNTATIRLFPDFNPEDLIAKSNWRSQRDGKPAQIGQVIPVNIDFASTADLLSSYNGINSYRLKLKLEGAKAVILYYDDFKIPEGGKLYIYTPDHESVLGAYTSSTHTRSGSFATEPILGSELIMEYEAPQNGAMPTIKIDGVGYIFNKIGGRPVTDEHYGIGEDDSDASCEININCPEGADWQTEKNGIVQMIMRDGYYLAMCSGNLLNNTNQDFTPLILSAGHCASLTENFEVSQSDLNQWIFTFHYEKRGCSNGSLATLRGNSIVGATKKAFLPIKGKSDGLLLQLNDQIPLRYRVYYNGWDNSSKRPSSGAGIHHPAGDAMKVSILTKKPVLATWNSFSVSGGSQDHFYFQYELGGTEGGSSGSSLFNEDKLVVGTLTGGAGSCGGTEFYGRLNSHWNKYAFAGNDSRMDIYLDPKNNGETTSLPGTYREGYKPLPSVPAVFAQYKGDHVDLSWDAVPQNEYPDSYTVEYHVFRNGSKIKTTDLLSYSDPVNQDIIGAGIIRYEVRARYIYPNPVDNVETYKDTDKTSADLAIGEIQTKLKPTISENPSGGVNLSWKIPYLSQLVSRFGEDPNAVFKKFSIPHVSAQDAHTTTAPLSIVVADKFLVGTYPEKVSIVRVEVMPSAPDSTFHIFLKSSITKRTQKVTTPSDWEEGSWLKVDLKKPYLIDNKQILFAGVKMSNKEKFNRAICYVKDPDDLYSLTGKKISYDYGQTFSGTGIPNLRGYLALKYLVVNSNESNIDMSLVQEPYAKGTTIAPFPQLIGIRIYKNGTLIESQGPGSTSYTDVNGSTTEDYEIELVYQGTGIPNSNIQIDNNNAVIAFPSVVNDRFGIKNVHMVQTATLYSIDGKQVRSWNNLESGVTFSVEGLPEGTYMLLMQTANGPISQKIIKK